MQFAEETALGSLAKAVDLCFLQAVLSHLYSVNSISILNCYLTRTRYLSSWVPWIASARFLQVAGS